METTTYARESELESQHWWFTTRRWMFSRIVKSWKLPEDAPILDVGSSSGTNLRMLRDMGFVNYSGLDMSDESIRFCSEKGLGEVIKGDVCHLPHADNQFSLVLATDIIEHVDDDLLALKELYRILSPGGHILLTVPAFMSLWGLQDDVSHHKRRYKKGELKKRLENTGIDYETMYYFNYLLFVPIWAARQLIKLFNISVDSENDINNPLINYLLSAIFRLDVMTAKFIQPPFGVSILATIKKPAS